jgi:hypothetical protein
MKERRKFIDKFVDGMIAEKQEVTDRRDYRVFTLLPGSQMNPQRQMGRVCMWRLMKHGLDRIKRSEAQYSIVLSLQDVQNTTIVSNVNEFCEPFAVWVFGQQVAKRWIGELCHIFSNFSGGVTRC